MRIVVIGGSGLIGSKLVAKLRDCGHEVIAASPSTGVNTITGEGLRKTMQGVEVVVDVANSPTFEDHVAMNFFKTSGRNLAREEADAGVQHHIALSVVGTDRLQSSGYFRAKLAQEELIKSSSIPYTIVRATQFFEFVSAIADSATEGDMVHLPAAMMQPIVSDDVAKLLADAVQEGPVNEIKEIAGPELIRIDDLVRRFLVARGDSRQVLTDPKSLYFGITVDDQSLVPSDSPRLGSMRFDDWLIRSTD